jgi:hypothetical protein
MREGNLAKQQREGREGRYVGVAEGGDGFNMGAVRVPSLEAAASCSTPSINLDPLRIAKEILIEQLASTNETPRQLHGARDHQC